jgi:hypothetical protein
VLLGGTNPEYALSILIYDPHVGTHRFVITAGFLAFGQVVRHAVGQMLTSSWNAGDSTTDEGAVTVDALAVDKASGTFSFVARSYNGTAEPLRVTNGRFNVPMRDQ